MKLKPYFIWMGNWSDMSGGTAVLNVLAERLRRLGAQVYLSSDDQNPNFGRFPLINSFVDNKEDVIAIYPEVVGGSNPFGCGIVVHYILNAPGFFNIPFNPSLNDILFVHKGFEHSVNLPKERILSLHFMTLHKSYDMKKERTKVFCFRGKGSQPDIEKLKDIERIEPYIKQGQDVLCEVLNQTKILYCYDNISAIVESARLCGCPVVIIPDKKYPESSFRNGITFNLGGLGYGLEEEEYATQSIDAERMRKFYAEDWEDAMNIDVRRFFKITQKGK